MVPSRTWVFRWTFLPTVPSGKQVFRWTIFILLLLHTSKNQRQHLWTSQHSTDKALVLSHFKHQRTITEESSCSCKSMQTTLENSSIQTTEPIIKCHTILEMGSHGRSAHTFGSSLRFLEVPQKVFFKTKC